MKKRIRQFIVRNLYSKQEREYIQEALYYDLRRIITSKEALQGRYDQDEKINSKVAFDFQ